jgi:hypothetical protein
VPWSKAFEQTGVMQRSSLVLACALLGCIALQATAFVLSAQPYQTRTALKTSIAAAVASKAHVVALCMSSDASDEVRAQACISNAIGSCFRFALVDCYVLMKVCVLHLSQAHQLIPTLAPDGLDWDFSQRYSGCKSWLEIILPQNLDGSI